MNEDKVVYEGVCQGTKMRIVQFYDTFFAHYAYRLQRKVEGFKFLFWTFDGFWTTIETDHLATRYDKWATHYELNRVKIPYKP